MDVMIRTDASEKIGSGHVIRCVTIAKALRQRGCRVFFQMEELPGNMIEFVQSLGFSVVNQFHSVDICIIDHYDIDIQWEQKIRPLVKKIVVIDDLANRKHDCDLILDQNIVPDFEVRYNDLVPNHCVKLLGSTYLIMREEFIKQRKIVQVRTGLVKRLLIFMGGADPTLETVKVLKALKKRKSLFEHVDVVVGSSNVQKQYIHMMCQNEGWHFHCQIDYLAQLMAQADFSIGAGGSTTWERCYVGLPSSSTIVANNQITTTETASSLGAVWNIGWHQNVSEETYEKLLASLQYYKEELNQISKRGLKLTESAKGANPWIEQIMEVTNSENR